MPDEVARDRHGARWWARAVTPPILVIAARGRASPRSVSSAPRSVPEPPPASEPAGAARVRGTSRRAGRGRFAGWDGGTVAEAYLAKWPQWVAAARGHGPARRLSRGARRASISPATTWPRTTCSSRSPTSSPAPPTGAIACRSSTGAGGSGTTPWSRGPCCPRSSSTGTAARSRPSRARARRSTRRSRSTTTTPASTARTTSCSRRARSSTSPTGRRCCGASPARPRASCSSPGSPSRSRRRPS